MKEEVNSTEKEAKRFLEKYSIRNRELLVVGAFDVGVTVLSQQVRAMNLAWALVESNTIHTNVSESSGKKAPKIAIIGAGFTGLSLAAALLRKGVQSEITLFERRDTLLPLQQGSDSRRLHPNIYDWPTAQSEATSASLPLLNWTAGRASDVVVQVLRGWETEIDKAENNGNIFNLYCNVSHLQIHAEPMSEKFRIEWVGEQRKSRNGVEPHLGESKPKGQSDVFGLVILAIGFGLESDEAHSYWRNETLAQPHLHEPTLTYIVSGQGDGAMIDLLRLRVSQFRQDRILSELFSGSGKFQLVRELRGIANSDAEGGKDTFASLELIFGNGSALEILNELRGRLRQDTRVLLHLKVKRFSELFSNNEIRLSFQNKILVYLLYKCGGFSPISGDIQGIVKQHGVPVSRIIIRHGSDKNTLFKGLLSEELFNLVVAKTNGKEGSLGRPVVKVLSQSSVPAWPGGYFGYEGRKDQAKSQKDDVKSEWRKEYLPSPTYLLALNLSSAIVGLVSPMHEPNKRLRVTLHRVVCIGDEWLLQQACDYAGSTLENSDEKTAARTFPAKNATVGLAFRTRSIIRSKFEVDPQVLKNTMQTLNLNDASRNMSDSVRFVCAIPLLFAEGVNSRGVCGVLYIDSSSEKFFLNDEHLVYLCSLAEYFLRSLSKLSIKPVDRIINYGFRFSGLDEEGRFFPRAEDLIAYPGLSYVSNVSAPCIDIAEIQGSEFLLNFEHVDFLPVGN